MKQLADSDIVHVHGGGDFEGGLPLNPIHGPSDAQIAQLLAWLSGPRTEHHAD